MNLVELYKGFLKWSWSTLQHLQFWRYYTIPFPCKSPGLQIIAEVSKIARAMRPDVNFIFIELSEPTKNNFVKKCCVLEIKNAVTLIKTRFY